MNKTARLLLFGQVSLMAFLIVCSLLNPHFIRTEGGVSNYGVHKLTIIPYTLAFGLCAAFTALAAQSVPKAIKEASKRLYILAGMYALLLISTYPYKLNRTLDDIHILVAVILFAATLLISYWLVKKLRDNSIVTSFFMVLAMGSLISLISLIGVVHFLYVGQVIASAGFAVLLIVSMQILAFKQGLNK